MEETSWVSAVSMELKNKKKSLTHKLHVGEKQITKQFAQTPTTFGLTSYAKFPGKVVNPKQRLLAKHFYVEYHILRLTFNLFPFSISATIFIAVDTAQQNNIESWSVLERFR